LKAQKDLEFPEFQTDKKSKSLLSNGSIGKNKATLLLPQTFMNKSGSAVLNFVKPKVKSSKKGIENLAVIYDDIDLPLGTLKISYNKGTGGHRGLDSIVKTLKTKEFTRLRIGISPVTPKGSIRKPNGEKAVLDFILGKFKPAELEILKKTIKKAISALETIVNEGWERAMNDHN